MIHAVLHKEISQRRLNETLSIETKMMREERSSKNDIAFGGIVSLLKFSSPLKDYKGKDNKEIRLRTLYFIDGDQEGHSWQSILDDERGYVLLQSHRFGELQEYFSNYSQERLERWEETGIAYHNEILRKLEELYWKNKPISEHLFY